ncbi:MAG: PH domain-containing protein [Tepidiformaceae bacterium]
MVNAGSRPRRKLTTVAFRPPRALGVIVGGALAAWAFVLAFLCLRLALDASVEFRSFATFAVGTLLALLGIAFANWTYSLSTLSYTITRHALLIRWGFRQVIVPIEAIQRMIPGRTLDEAKVAGLNWWGCHVGHSEVKRVGYTLFYSTHSSPDELLFVVTNADAYALTVLDQASFAEEIQARAELDPVEQQVQRSTASGIAALPFWRDRVALLAAAGGAICCALLAGFVYWQYPALPKVIQLSFPELGGVVRVGDKSELLHIVYLAVGVLAVNTALGIAVHARERAAGLWLFASGSAVQFVLLAASFIAIQKS